MIARVQRFNDIVPALHRFSLPGAKILIVADVAEFMSGRVDQIRHLQAILMIPGKIDAAFVVAGAPTVAVSTLATTHDVRLVSIDDEHMEALIEASPYYTPVTIAASVYGTDEDCQTVAVGAVVIARDDVSEDAIYDVVSTIFNDKEAISQSHDKGNELDLSFATSITTVPYHPGAAKYFAEQGIEVPVK